MPSGAELLVLDGAFDEGGQHLEPQSWLRLPTGSTLDAKTGPEGCRVWAKTGPPPAHRAYFGLNGSNGAIPQRTLIAGVFR